MAYFEGDTMVSQVLDFIFAGLHFPCVQSPGSDDFHFRSKCFDCQFETNLVITFTCCTVADRCCAFCFRDFNHSLSNDGTSHGCTQQVFAFIYSVCFYTGVNSVCDEFFYQIFDVQFGSACFQCFFFQTICFFTLTYVTAYADNFTVVVFFQPRDDAGCIQTAGICQNDFFFCHDVFPPLNQVLQLGTSVRINFISGLYISYSGIATPEIIFFAYLCIFLIL